MQYNYHIQRYQDRSVKMKNFFTSFHRVRHRSRGGIPSVKYEIFSLLQQYLKKYPEQFHNVTARDLQEKYFELKSEGVKTNACTLNSDPCSCSRAGYLQG